MMKRMKYDAFKIVFIMMVLLLNNLSVGTAAGFVQENYQPVSLDPFSNLLREKDGMIMVSVPAGEFMMGSNEGNDNEKPVHNVYLDTFWIDQTEITNSQFEKCVAEGICALPISSASKTRPNYFGNPEYKDYPVINLVWDQANTYCNWAGGRLPTEAEWEKAARGTDQRIYPWGNVVDKTLANYNADTGDTIQVGSFPTGVSPYGVLDMAGNVWEWIFDWDVKDYYKSSPNQNPTGPASGQNRVARGGSWNDSASVLRSSYRYRYDPSSSAVYLGVRCAYSVTANLPVLSTIPVKLATVTSLTINDKAEWKNQSIADGTHFAAGESGDLTWFIANIGTTVWTTDYSLRFYSGTNFAKAGNTRYALPVSVSPKETAAITIDFSAPETPGEYKMSWVLSNPNDENFYSVNFTIIVDPRPSTEDAANYVNQSMANGTHYATGENGDLTWFFTNVGSTTWSTSYSLRFSSGTNFAKVGNTRYTLPVSVAPQENAAVTIDIVAPEAPGEYQMTWVLANEQDNSFFSVSYTIIVD